MDLRSRSRLSDDDCSVQKFIDHCLESTATRRPLLLPMPSDGMHVMVGALSPPLFVALTRNGGTDPNAKESWRRVKISSWAGNQRALVDGLSVAVSGRGGSRAGGGRVQAQLKPCLHRFSSSLVLP